MGLAADRPGDAPSAAPRPSPRRAALLSRAFPGLGQAYCGALAAALLFAGLGVFFVLSILQVWDQWKRSYLLLPLGALVLALYAATAALASAHAERRARSMERHGAVWRHLAWWVRTGGAAQSASEAALLLAFVVATAGLLARWPPAHAIAHALWYWPVFELLGGLTVALYAGFVDDLEAGRARPYPTRNLVAGLVIFQCLAAAALYRLFHPPLLTVVAACALTLPGQVKTLSIVNGDGRGQAKLRAGAIVLALLFSVIPALILATVFERRGAPRPDPAYASMAIGAAYTFMRIVLDALIRKGLVGPR